MKTTDAALLGCPFARVVTFSGDGGSNRQAQGRFAAIIGPTYSPDCLCVTVKCMAWTATDAQNGDCALMQIPQGATRQ